MPNGIDLIVADHQVVSELFDEFDRSGNSTLVGQIIDSLSRHDQAEHAALYPFAGTVLGNEALIMRSAAAHSALKKQIDSLTTLEGTSLVAAVGGLRKLVDKHVADEENNLLPALAAAASEQQLDALGARIMQAKQRGG
jgi:hemerythrin superfamily protein